MKSYNCINSDKKLLWLWYVMTKIYLSISDIEFFYIWKFMERKNFSKKNFFETKSRGLWLDSNLLRPAANLQPLFFLLSVSHRWPYRYSAFLTLTFGSPGPNVTPLDAANPSTASSIATSRDVVPEGVGTMWLWIRTTSSWLLRCRLVLCWLLHSSFPVPMPLK